MLAIECLVARGQAEVRMVDEKAPRGRGSLSLSLAGCPQLLFTLSGPHGPLLMGAASRELAQAHQIAPGVFLPRPDGTASFDNLVAGSWSLSFAGLRARKGVPPEAVLVHQDGRVFLLDDDFENGFVFKLEVAASSTARARLQGTFAPETMQPGKCC